MRENIRKWVVVGTVASAALLFPGCADTNQGMDTGAEDQMGTGGAGMEGQEGLGGSGTGGGPMTRDAGTPGPADTGTGGAGMEGQGGTGGTSDDESGGLPTK